MADAYRDQQPAAQDIQGTSTAHRNKKGLKSGRIRTWLGTFRIHLQTLVNGAPRLYTETPLGEDPKRYVEDQADVLEAHLQRLKKKITELDQKEHEWTTIMDEAPSEDIRQLELEEYEKAMAGNPAFMEIMIKAEEKVFQLEVDLTKARRIVQRLVEETSSRGSRAPSQASVFGDAMRMMNPQPTVDRGQPSLEGEAAIRVEERRGSTEERFTALPAAAAALPMVRTHVAPRYEGFAPRHEPSAGIAMVEPRLPKLEITPFDGDQLKWLEFWGAFSNTIDKSRSIASTTKYSYLLKMTTGIPHSIVAAYSITADYCGAITALKKKYGNDSAVKQALYRQLRTLDKRLAFPLLVVQIENILRQLEALGDYVNTEPVRIDVESVLPRWALLRAKEREDSHPAWTLAELRDLLEALARQQEAVDRVANAVGALTIKDDSTKGQASPPRNRQKGRDGITLVTPAWTDSSRNRSRSCILCGKEHPEHRCVKYGTAEARRKRMIELKRCCKCKASIDSHDYKACECKVECYECGGKHFLFLCKVRFPTTGGGQTLGNKTKDQEKSGTLVTFEGCEEADDGEAVKDTTTCCQEVGEMNPSAVIASIGSAQLQTILMTKEVSVTRPSGGKHRKGLGILDPCSTHSYITTSLAQSLGLPKVREESRSVGVFGSDMRREEKIPIVALKLNYESGETLQMEAGVMPVITPPVKVVQPKSDIQATPILLETKSEEPLILVGADYLYEVVDYGTSYSLPSGFQWINSKLGGMITGRGWAENISTSRADEVTSIVCAATADQLWEARIEDFWRLEVIPGLMEGAYVSDDEVARRFFEDTTYFDVVRGRFVVQWPWLDDDPRLPESFYMAWKRLEAEWRRLGKDPPKRLRYHSTLVKWEAGGITEIVDPKQKPLGPVWYVPHKSHETAAKVTEGGEPKPRPVHDASAEVGGISINKKMHRGPSQIPKVVELLTRVRQKKILLCGDLEKAFLQIELAPESRDATRFLWVKDPDKPPTRDNLVIYRFTRTGFGFIASPSILNGCQLLLYKRDGSEFALSLIDDTYVDNVFRACDTAEQAIEAYLKLKALYASASMNIRDFSCNSMKVLEAIPEEDREKKRKISLLGLEWDTGMDLVSVHIPQAVSPAAWTKRTVLAFIGKIYDPLGFVSPIVLSLKIYLQKLWGAKLGWDEPLGLELAKEWKELIDWDKYSYVAPRALARGDWSEAQLHAFTDASEKGYGAVVYLRWQEKGRFHTSIVISKTRVTPNKKALSIPRLELLGVQVGASLAGFICEQTKFNGRVVIWTDNTATLGWLNSPEDKEGKKERWNINRQRAIRKAAPTADYGHIAGVNNPADLASRGTDPKTLLGGGEKTKLWRHGPEFLWTKEEDWPVEPTPLPTFEEKEQEPPLGECSEVIAATVDSPREEPLVIIKKDQTLVHLLHTTTLVVRFTNKIIKNLQDKGKLTRIEAGTTPLARMLRGISIDGPPTAIDFESSRRFLLIRAQLEHGSSKDMRRHKFSTDEMGMKWCHFRLPAEDGGEARLPYLPRSGRFTNLLVEEAHRRVGHSAESHTMAMLYERYWLPRSRQAAHRVISRCQVCEVWRTKPFRLPPMAPQRQERTKPNPPFTYTGLDYLGPMWVQEKGGGRTKAWVCLFTCYTTRMSHLEPVFALTATAFLDALRKLVARRGLPRRITCDNAQQFRLASKATMTSKMFLVGEVADYSRANGISWHFIPAYSPWVGGIYERVVGLFKAIFKRVIGRATLTVEELLLVVPEVEAILNSRPLTYQGEDGFVVLKPINILIPDARLQPDLVPLDDDTYEENINSSEALLRHYAATSKRVDSMWRLFQRHYVRELGELAYEHRNPRSTTKRLPTVGERVIIQNTAAPRNHWPIGTIEKLHPSLDGHIRSVTVRLQSGKFTKRSVNQLCPLELAAGEQGDGLQAKPDYRLDIASDDSADEEEVEPTRAAARLTKRQQALARKKEARNPNSFLPAPEGLNYETPGGALC